jgi:fucose 4-O-acetylase-like acetyltransferase
MTKRPAGGRDAWVDYAKAIGIVLVVYGHVARGVYNAGIPMDTGLYERVDSIIYSFHMPLFFFLSGLFFFHSLKRRGPTALVANKVDTILYPYILWSLIQGLTEVWLSNYTTGKTTLSEVLSLWDPRVQFWFLYALFLVVLGAIVVYRRDSRPLLVTVLVISALACVFQNRIPSAFHSDYVVKNFVFFALGVWFNSVQHRMSQHPRFWAAVGILAFVAVQYFFHVVLGLQYTDKGVASLLVAVVSILSVTSVSMLLSRTPVPWILAMGSASMAIYLMHILAGSGARIFLSRVIGVQDAGVHLLIGCLAGTLLPMLFLHLSERVGLRGLLSAPPWISAEVLYRRLLSKGATQHV